MSQPSAPKVSQLIDGSDTTDPAFLAVEVVKATHSRNLQVLKLARGDIVTAIATCGMETFVMDWLGGVGWVLNNHLALPDNITKVSTLEEVPNTYYAPAMAKLREESNTALELERAEAAQLRATTSHLRQKLKSILKGEKVNTLDQDALAPLAHLTLLECEDKTVAEAERLIVAALKQPSVKVEGEKAALQMDAEIQLLRSAIQSLYGRSFIWKQSVTGTGPARREE